jgi:hypothetical protein
MESLKDASQDISGCHEMNLGASELYHYHCQLQNGCIRFDNNKLNSFQRE